MGIIIGAVFSRTLQQIAKSAAMGWIGLFSMANRRLGKFYDAVAETI
ncbi:MAG: hypothetical protein Fur0043_05910 [Anaerolineales bacterium]